MKKYLILALFIIGILPLALAANSASISSAQTIKSIEKTDAKLSAQTINPEQIRAHQRQQLMIAVDKCREKNQSAELCEKKLQNRIALIDKLNSSDLARLNRAQERMGLRLQELKQMQTSSAFSKFVSTNQLKARLISKSMLEKAQANYLQAKEKFQNTKLKYSDTEKKFQKSKEKLANCSGNCTEIKKEISDNAKMFLLATADNMLEYLNQVKAKAESSEDLTDEESSEMISDIDSMIKEINDAKSVIESSKDKAQIMDAAKQIKQAWAKINKRILVHTGKVINARVGGILVKSKQLEVKLERVLARMEEQGKNTTQIQPIIDNFDAKIQEAKASYESALKKFNEALLTHDSQKAHQIALEGHKLMKDASKSLQEAQKLLKDVIQMINDKGGEEELSEEAEEQTLD